MRCGRWRNIRISLINTVCFPDASFSEQMRVFEGRETLFPSLLLMLANDLATIVLRQHESQWRTQYRTDRSSDSASSFTTPALNQPVEKTHQDKRNKNCGQFPHWAAILTRLAF